MTLWDSVDDEPVDSSDTPDQPETWTIAELSAAIGSGLRARFPTEVWLRGEISGMRPVGRTGHQYFDLIEPGSEPGTYPDAKLSVSLFRTSRARVLDVLAAAPGAATMADGVEVRIRGKVDWWASGGQLRIVMSDIDPVFTLGQLDAQRRALLALLASEGLLDANSRLAVPPVPLRVGLVTSAGSAAHADFVNELRSSPYAFDVLLADARVQGADAPRTIVAGIDKVAGLGVDVIAVVRGGGSRSDLVAFDHADVAHAIARAPVPVFTGIGHEIDRSVADEVAHHAFKTPTAVAGALIARVAEAESSLERAATRLAQLTSRRLVGAANDLDTRLDRVARAARVADTRATTHLNSIRDRLGAGARRSLRDADRSVRRRVDRLGAAPARHLDRASSRLAIAQARSDASDPRRLLERGWTITRSDDGTLVRSVTGIRAGQVLTTTLIDGTVTGTVDSVTTEEHAHDR